MNRTRRTTNLTITLAGIALAAVGLAGCSSSTSSTPAASATTPPVAATTSAPASAPPSSAPASGAVTVMTRTGPLGTYLVDSSGKTLYLFTADTGSTSTCTGQCAVAWPPLTGTATAGTGVTGSLLATSARSDGSTQVTYDGHPLYYFDKDTGPGTTAGQGVGGVWFVVDATGAAIKATR